MLTCGFINWSLPYIEVGSLPGVALHAACFSFKPLPKINRICFKDNDAFVPIGSDLALAPIMPQSSDFHPPVTSRISSTMGLLSSPFGLNSGEKLRKTGIVLLSFQLTHFRKHTSQMLKRDNLYLFSIRHSP